MREIVLAALFVNVIRNIWVSPSYLFREWKAVPGTHMGRLTVVKEYLSVERRRL